MSHRTKYRTWYVAEDAGEGCWVAAPYKPVVPFAKGGEWWKCGVCGFINEDTCICKYCSRVRDE